MLAKEFLSWNEKINLISRKDTENLFEHHILHSLAIAKVCKFKPQCEVMDIGTGGGFPGLPLAIMFPETTNEPLRFADYPENSIPAPV